MKQMTREQILLILSIVLFIGALAIGLHMVWAGLNTNTEIDLLKTRLEEQNKVTIRRIDSLHVVIKDKELIVDSLLSKGKQLEDKITQKDREINEAKAKIKTNQDALDFIVKRYKP